MGKATLIATIAIGFMALLLQNNATSTEHEIDVQNASQQKNMAVRELALEGRRLVLANWMASNGAQSSSPYSSLNRNGGVISVTSYALASNVLDFTVQAAIDSSVHEIRSRFRWVSFPVNPVQMRVPALNPIIDPLATLNINEIIIDDQSLDDLDAVLVDDLNLADSLGALGLGSSQIESELKSALTSSGHAVGVDVINAADRALYEQENGLYFAQQVDQAVQAFSLLNPSLVQSVPDGSSVGSTFGISDGYEMLKVTGDLILSADFQGKGILVVEGNLIIPDGKNFDWEGMLLIKPPTEDHNPKIDLSGNVNIEGSLIAIQEGLPNTGHMDFTVMNDPSGSWYTAHGAHTPWWQHTHDFSGSHGTQVVYQTNHFGVSDHDFASNFDQLIGSLSSSDSVYLEIYNPGNHGMGILSLDLLGQPATSSPVAAGFDPILANPVNQYITNPFKVSDFEHLDIAITRLSSLKKMWDSDAGYPGCISTDDGPNCVASSHDRHQALTLRLYVTSGGFTKRVYDTSLYWHRRQDEEEDFENEMNDLLTDIQSSNYGMDLNIGDTVTITENASAIASLGAFGGTPIGMTHLGTWHRHWEPGDAGHPYLVVSP